jgi:hypothetical protein
VDSIWRTRAQLLMANVTNASKCSQVIAVARACLETQGERVATQMCLL